MDFHFDSDSFAYDVCLSKLDNVYLPTIYAFAYLPFCFLSKTFDDDLGTWLE